MPLDGMDGRDEEGPGVGRWVVLAVVGVALGMMLASWIGGWAG